MVRAAQKGLPAKLHAVIIIKNAGEEEDAATAAAARPRDLCNRGHNSWSVPWIIKIRITF